MRPAVLIIPAIVLALCAPAFGGGSAVLVVRNAPDDMFTDSEAGGAEIEHGENTYTVIGLLNPPSLSAAEVANVAIYDADSKPVRLRIEESSIYREFDDINSMRVVFEVDRSILAKGPLRVEWGGEVSAENEIVEKILVNPGERERYKTFVVEERPAAGDDSQFAKIEVIVDDAADLYYLWYLLPMVLIFGMLAVRKYFAGKPAQSSGE